MTTTAIAPKTKKPVYRAVKFTGELPPLNGKERIPSLFDDLMKDAYESGETFLVEVGADDEDGRKHVIAQLHKAAKFVDCGLDLWRSLPQGVAFKTRAKRVVTKKPSVQAPAA